MKPSPRRFIAVLTSLLAFGQCAFGSDVMDFLKSWEKERARQKELVLPRRTSPTVEIKYTAEQIEAIRGRARSAWRQYLGLRPDLRKHDIYEQAYARRAAALRFRIQAFEKTLKDERKKPTPTGTATVGEALTWLDRATAAVEYDYGRVTLRMAQEKILPPGRPFCVCAGPAHQRLAPGDAGACPPVAGLRLSLAAGEAESFQLLAVPYWKPLRSLRIEVGPLFQHGSISQIAAGQVDVWLIESIRNHPEVGRDRYWPDPLLPARPIDVPATSTLAVLITVRARPDQPPGSYEGRITFTANDTERMEVPVQVRVRGFSVAQDLPTVGYWVRNENLASCFTTDLPNQLARECREFLARYAIQLYRPAHPGDDAAEGWVAWAPGYDLKLSDVSPLDPFSLAAPSALAYRRAGWTAWQLTSRGLGSNRWLIPDWVAVARNSPDPGGNLRVPLIWGDWQTEGALPPPGLVYFNARSMPVPSLRLTALRDGIEDFAYQQILVDRFRRARELKAVGWWKRRKFNRLLSTDPKILDPAARIEESEQALFQRREAIAETIEQLDRLIRKAKPD